MTLKIFFQFLRKTKLPFFFTWVLNIGYLLIIAFIIYKGNGSSIPLIFITIMFLAQKLLLYITAFIPYNAGLQAIKELKCEKKESLEGISVYVRNFDLFDQKHPYAPNIRKTIYNFDKADLILTKHSMVLMGKGKGFGGEGYAYPIELSINNLWLTSLPKVQIKNWEQSDNRIKIQIEDNQYKNPIKIDFKDGVEEIKKWLTVLTNE